MMAAQIDSVLSVSGVVQNYGWGRRGQKSLVARLSSSPGETEPYAELWFGAHSKAPSPVPALGTTLDRLIAADPARHLGAKVSERFSASLPFLFKVLSIGDALSIQAHPDRGRAGELHRISPENYPDPNHKPEIAVALSGLEYLAGFVSAAELEATLNRLPELREVLAENSDPARAFCAVFEKSAAERRSCAEAVKNRLASTGQLDADRWFLKLYPNFAPAGDPGLFAFYLLKLGRLSPGQALFTGANIVHAYLDGEIVECMANSDNVVRAGLTAKHRDVDTLVQMVELSKGASPHRLDSPDRVGGVDSYRSPAEEFLVQRIGASAAASTPGSPGGPELIVSIDAEGILEYDGKSAVVAPGSAFFKSAVNQGYLLKLSGGVCYRVVVP